MCDDILTWPVQTANVTWYNILCALWNNRPSHNISCKITTVSRRSDFFPAWNLRVGYFALSHWVSRLGRAGRLTDTDAKPGGSRRLTLQHPLSVSSRQGSSGDNCHPHLVPLTRTARENRERRGNSVTGADAATNSQSLTSSCERTLITMCVNTAETWHKHKLWDSCVRFKVDRQTKLALL